MQQSQEEDFWRIFVMIYDIDHKNTFFIMSRI